MTVFHSKKGSLNFIVARMVRAMVTLINHVMNVEVLWNIRETEVLVQFHKI